MPKVKNLWRSNRFSFLTNEQDVRQYFGEGVALYFAWMNCFTTWLVVPGVLSAGVWLSYQLTGSGGMGGAYHIGLGFEIYSLRLEFHCLGEAKSLGFRLRLLL